MSQLENTQAVVLQQTDGKKIYLDLNVSTDTTAIWSFWLAMIVALILGASATLIAIWYGRKSFKLTEMSFDTVIEQIKASERSALDLNSKIFEQQKHLQVNELENKDKQKWLFEVRKNLANYSKNYEILRCRMLTFNKRYYLDINVHLDNFEKENKLERYNELNEINNLTEIMLLNITGFESYFNNSNEHMSLILKGLEVVEVAKNILNLLFHEGNEDKIESIMDVFIESHLEFMFSMKELLNPKAA